MCGWIKHTPLCVFVCLFYRHSEDMIVTPFAQVSISNHWCILYFAEERQQVVQLKQCFYALNAANTHCENYLSTNPSVNCHGKIIYLSIYWTLMYWQYIPYMEYMHFPVFFTKHLLLFSYMIVGFSVFCNVFNCSLFV